MSPAIACDLLILRPTKLFCCRATSCVIELTVAGMDGTVIVWSMVVNDRNSECLGCFEVVLVCRVKNCRCLECSCEMKVEELRVDTMFDFVCCDRYGLG